MPDDLLRATADDGSLLKKDVLKEQVDRMLSDPAISAFCQTFPARWLGVEKVMNVDVDPLMFPWVTWGLRKDMLEETRQVFNEILRNNSSCLELIDSNWTFLNSRLARHYGLPELKGDHMRRVSLPAGSERGGIPCPWEHPHHNLQWDEALTHHPWRIRAENIPSRYPTPPRRTLRHRRKSSNPGPTQPPAKCRTSSK